MARLNVLEKRKIRSPCRNTNPGSSTCNLVYSIRHSCSVLDTGTFGKHSPVTREGKKSGGIGEYPAEVGQPVGRTRWSKCEEVNCAQPISFALEHLVFGTASDEIQPVVCSIKSGFDFRSEFKWLVSLLSLVSLPLTRYWHIKRGHVFCYLPSTTRSLPCLALFLTCKVSPTATRKASECRAINRPRENTIKIPLTEQTLAAFNTRRKRCVKEFLHKSYSIKIWPTTFAGLLKWIPSNSTARIATCKVWSSC